MLGVELSWYGVATFRLRVGSTVIFLDAYLDRIAGAPPNGLAVADVSEADVILIGHSHFDHLAGAHTIATRTGARIIGSHETVRLMGNAGVPGSQLLAVSAGDLVELGPGVRARVLPSIHSCNWAAPMPGSADESNLTLPERQRRLAQRPMPPEVLAYVQACGERPRGDGGAYGYLLDTPAGRLYWADTSGYWSGIVRDLRPDVAILAAAGRGNVDGEPSPETLPGFIAGEVELMRPGQVVLCHHDDWLPPTTSAGDTDAIRAAVAGRTPGIAVHSLAYGEPFAIGGAIHG